MKAKTCFWRKKYLKRSNLQACRLLPVAQLLPAGLCHPVEVRGGEYLCFTDAVFRAFMSQSRIFTLGPGTPSIPASPGTPGSP